jgi:hypothetical protein
MIPDPERQVLVPFRTLWSLLKIRARPFWRKGKQMAVNRHKLKPKLSVGIRAYKMPGR